MPDYNPYILSRKRIIVHLAIIVFVTCACLLPFIGKAFNMDDPLFIWAARHILNDPVNFYDFTLNWYGHEMSMSEVMKNPPLTSYYLAAAGSVVGWTEQALHTAFLLPALALTVGTYFLSKRFCLYPLAATLALVATPVFIVSSTSVMSDIMMLAFWCWAVIFWCRGLDKEEPYILLVAGLLIALCAFTKYFGMSLIPLLFAYTLFRGKLRWASFLILPLGLLAGYQWFTHGLYGRGLLFDAAEYAVGVGNLGVSNLIRKGFVGLSFTGGCVLIQLFFAPVILSRIALIIGAAVSAVLFIVCYALENPGGLFSVAVDGPGWEVLIELALFVVAGTGALILSFTDLLKRRDPGSVLLFFWIVGTFVFAAFINWSANGRSILPMAPAIAILIMRRLEDRDGSIVEGLRHYLPILPALFIAFIVMQTEYSVANSTRTAANNLYAKYSKRFESVWYQGHWGFQYYMDSYGLKPVDFSSSRISRGDVIIVPLYNTNLKKIPGVVEIERMNQAVSGWATTMSTEFGAGFYSSIWGPLPYVLGVSRDEKYLVHYVEKDIQF